MQSKTVAYSNYERPIQALAELLEIRGVTEKGSTSSWPVCELVRPHNECCRGGGGGGGGEEGKVV